MTDKPDANSRNKSRIEYDTRYEKTRRVLLLTFGKNQDQQDLLDQISKAAKLSGVSPQKYILTTLAKSFDGSQDSDSVRREIKIHRLLETIKEQNDEMLAQVIGKIGNNINQITRSYNRSFISRNKAIRELEAYTPMLHKKMVNFFVALDTTLKKFTEGI